MKLLLSIVIAVLGIKAEAGEYVNICDRGVVIAEGILHSIRRETGRYGTPPTSCAEVYVESLNNLKELDIAGNCLSWPGMKCESGDGVLSENAFDGLNNVESLNLSYSGFTKINASSFKKLPKLKVLKLQMVSRWAGRPTYDESPFQHLKHLQELDLDYSSLGSNSTFDQKTFFKGLSTLTKLSLYGNGLTNLDEDVFRDLTNLRELSLSANSIELLPSRVFRSLKKLEVLHIGGTSARTSLTLPEDVFHGLTQLKILSVSQGVIDSLHENQFKSLINLETIFLNENFLTSLPQNLFLGLRNLRSVSLYNNPIKSVSKSYLGLSDTVVVDIPITP